MLKKPIFIEGTSHSSFQDLYKCIIFGIQIDGFAIHDNHLGIESILGFPVTEYLKLDCNKATIIGLGKCSVTFDKIVADKKPCNEYWLRKSESFDPFYLLMILDSFIDARIDNVILSSFSPDDNYLPIICHCLDYFGISHSFMLLSNISNSTSGVPVIICGNNDTQRKGYDILENRNLKAYKDFWGLRPFNYLGRNHTDCMAFDPLLNIAYDIGDSSGFEMIGSNSDSAYRVVVLGGSTSDEYYSFGDSWITCLNDKLKDEYNIVFFNGATRAYSVQQQLLKLIRDVPVLKPDLVICVPGTINVLYQFMKDHPFIMKMVEKRSKGMVSLYEDSIGKTIKMKYGTIDNSDQFEMMERCFNMMNAICSAIGTRFICVPFPYISRKKVLTKYESLYCYEDFCTQDRSSMRYELPAFFEKLDKKYLFFYNITDLFDNKPGIYVDRSHVIPEGDLLFADNIRRILLDNELI